MSSPGPLIAIAVYLVFLVGFALYRGRLKTVDMEEYAAGGRSFPWYMMAFTVMGSMFTAEFLSASTGMAVFSGAWVLYSMSYVFIGLAIFYFVAPKVWIWGKVHKLYNMPDYIQLRYNSRALTIIFAIGVGFLGAVWFVTGFKALGYVMYEASYHAIPWNAAIFIVPTFAAAYIVVGGMRSIVVTDFVQGLLSMVVVIFGIGFIIQKLFGGPGPMFAQLVAIQPVEWLTVSGVNIWSSVIIACALGSYCWLEEFNRIFVAKSTRDLKMIVRLVPFIYVVFAIIIDIFSLGCGLFPEFAESVETAESAIFVLAEQAGGGLLLAFFAIVIISAAMSNFDSGFHATAVVLSKNIISDSFKGGLSEKTQVLISRISVVALIYICAFMATRVTPLIVSIMITTYEFLLCFFPGIIIGIFWKRGCAAGTYASIAVAIPTVALLMTHPAWTGVFGGYGAGLIGGVFGLIAYIVVGFVKKPTTRVEELFKSAEEYKEVEA